MIDQGKNDIAVLREGVKLAEDWQTVRLGNQEIRVLIPHGEGGDYPLRDIGKLTDWWVKDVLAAQLERQIRALGYTLVLAPRGAAVWRKDKPSLPGYCKGEDRTMNIIIAIVESGVLKNES